MVATTCHGGLTANPLGSAKNPEIYKSCLREIAAKTETGIADRYSLVVPL
jgi:hypothetical protein